MTSAPDTPAPAAKATSHHADVLNDLIDIGHEFARMALSQAKAGAIPLLPATMAYDRLTRSIRRSMWLIHKLAEPAKTVDRFAARKQIIRVVEDKIQRHVDDEEEAETLREELMERLDASDLEDEIRGRKLDDIINDIVRDLGLAHVPGNHPWKRRTPDDVAQLCARAAQPAANGARHTPVTPAPTQAPPVSEPGNRIIKP